MSPLQDEGSLGSDVVAMSPDSKGNPDVKDVPKLTKKQLFTVGIICFINLINYMDRYTVAGVLYDIQKTFDITDGQAGLLQTAFIFVYMFMAPLFGYFGDRFTRKWLIASGIMFWSLSTLIGSFMSNFGSFLALRCLVGVGEASYTTNAPTIISDLFVGDMRSIMLSIFNFAIPVGAGLGYMLGAVVTMLAGSGMTEDERIAHEVWRWGLRITPGLGIIAVVLIIWLMDEPLRGESEGGHNLQTTSMAADLKYLITNKAFVLNTLGFSFVTFVMGALAWWAPLFINLGVKVQEVNGKSSNIPADSVAIVFGGVSMVSGLIGVPLGSYLGQKLRKKYPKADPLVCGIGVLVATPLFVITDFLTDINTLVAIIFCFFGQIFQNLNWSVVTDMMLYTVIPTRRSSASAFLILVSHALGDAISPYIMGAISEAFKPLINYEGDDTTTTISSLTTTDYSSEPSLSSTIPPGDTDEDNYVNFKSLQYAMIIITATNVFASVLFIWLAFHVVKAKNKVDDAIKGTQTIKNEKKTPTSPGWSDGKEKDNIEDSIEGFNNNAFLNDESNSKRVPD